MTTRNENLSVEELNRRQDAASIRDILVEKDVRVAYLQSQEFRSYAADLAHAMKGHQDVPETPEGMPSWAQSLAREMVEDVQGDPALARDERIALCGRLGHLRRGYHVGTKDSCSRCGGEGV